MGFANIDKELKAEARGAGGKSSENVAVMVSGYDAEKELVLGTRLDTSEEVRVRLRPWANAENSKHERAGVKDWSKTSGKKVVKPGGVIVFEAAWKEEDGVYCARWGKTASHSAEEAEVFIAPAQPLVSPRGTVGLEVLRTIAARSVKTPAELHSAVAEALAASRMSSAVVRIWAGGEKMRVFQVARTKKATDGSNSFVDRKPEDAASEWMADRVGANIAKEMVAEGCDFITEVIPAERIYAGRDTQATLNPQEEKGALRRKMLLEPFKMGESYGFTNAVVAARRHEEGGLFFTHFWPVSARPSLYAVSGVETNHIRPNVAPIINAQPEGGDQVDGSDLAAAGVGDVTAQVRDAARAYSGGRR
jgi:hypothetical protein